MKQERLELLVLARDATSTKNRDSDLVAAELHRFAPSSMTDAAWRDELASVRDGLGKLDARKDLVRRLRVKKLASWQSFADRVLPGLGLGIEATDTAVLAKLVGRDRWTAAIAARMLGMWGSGKPPSLASVCDAFAWRSLGLAGRVKRCPPEIRALFLQRELQSAEAAPDRQLRLFVARELQTSTDLRAMRDGLVRRWLQDQPLQRAVSEASLGVDVKRIARTINRGLFGERKVFISTIWDALRCEPQWASLTLSEFKTRLVVAQRSGDVELARADLVAAMDPQLVAASETRGDGASFHFIIREDGK